jgi:hypothetical protein
VGDVTMTTPPQDSNQQATGMRRRGAPKGTRSRLTHGLKSMKNALIRSKQVRLDMRFRLGKAAGSLEAGFGSRPGWRGSDIYTASGAD